MPRARALPLAVVVVLLAAPAWPASQSAPALTQLDRYFKGDFDAVARELGALESYDVLLEQLRIGAPGWIAAAPEVERPRRRLAAATFALEAARAADRADWKHLKRLLAQGNESGGSDPEGADRIFWQAPPLLIEWGCALMRSEPSPRPIERIWHIASISVAQRAGDFEFLVGSPVDARMNADDEIEHAYHASARFRDEVRFHLAAAIALDSLTWSRARGGVRTAPAAMAQKAFSALLNDDMVGAEAAMRLGALHARRNRLDDALELFDKAETLTRDRYVIYLTRYFKGQALERARRFDEAEASYRAALSAIPQTQSATLALGALLTAQGRRSEAASLVATQLSMTPAPPDPWLTYGAADDRFWPELIVRLRAGFLQEPAR